MTKEYKEALDRWYKPKAHKITINKTELLEAFKDEDSLDKYIDKLIDRVYYNVNSKR